MFQSVPLSSLDTPPRAAFRYRPTVPSRTSRVVGKCWLRRIGPALLVLGLGCADKGFEHLSPEPEGGARPPLPASARADSADDFAQLVIKDIDAVWVRNFANRRKTYS